MYNDTITRRVSKAGAFQGDVAIIRVDKLPDGAVPSTRKILADGESSGHHHILDTGVQGYAVGTDFYFVVAESGAAVRHQEHGTILLDPGTYMLGKPQREYDGEKERRVLD